MPSTHLPHPLLVVRSLRDRLAAAPRVSRAVKTTVAALIAWTLADVVPGPWSDYPYYAPLGAVVATSGSVHASWRQSLQAVGAIAIGALVARAVDALPLPALPSLALVVLLGLLVSGWTPLGDMGSWVPTSALFVLIIGDADPVGYVSAYVGLTLVGALIGVAVSALLPALPLTPADRALDRLRAATADHLDALGAAVESAEDDLTPVERTGARLRVRQVAATEAADQANDAARANWTARRYRDWRASQDRNARVLHRAAGFAADAERVVTDGPGWGRTRPEVRAAVAQALRAAGDVVRSTQDGTRDEATLSALSQALDDVQRALTEERAQTDGGTRPADGVVMALAPLLAEQ